MTFKVHETEMITVKYKDLKIAYSADKHNFSVYNGNKRIVYNLYKYRTLKYVEQCNKIYMLKGDEHFEALKLFLKNSFNIEIY